MHRTLSALTSAQARVWFAQQLDMEIPFTIAYYGDLTGDIDLELLARCGAQAHSDHESSTLRVTLDEGLPAVWVSANEELQIKRVDVRTSADPEVAARDWMLADGAAPMPMYDAPLVRCALIRLTDDRCFWYTRAHHIALDGYASTVVMRRTAELYLAAGEGRSLPEIAESTGQTLRRSDDKYRESARHDRDRDRWNSRLDRANSGAVTTLAGHAAPPGAQSIRVSGTLADDVADAIDESGRSTAAVVVAAFAAFLARMTDTDDVTLSLPVSARTTAELRRTAGSIAGVVPLDLGGVSSGTTASTVDAVESAVVGALRHQRFTPDGAASVPNFGPVVNVMMFDRRMALGDIEGDLHVLTTGPTTDIELSIYPAAGSTRPRLDLQANPASYTAREAGEHHRRFSAFLARWVRRPDDSQIDDITLELDDDTDADLSGPCGRRQLALPHMLSDAATSNPGGVAVVDGDLRITYSDLDARVDALAAELIERGAGPDVPVLVSITRSLESVVAFWAIARAGAVYVPIDPRAPADRESLIAADCSASLGITTSARKNGRVNGVEWIEVDGTTGGTASVPRIRPGNGAYIIYTSGSTGRPKGVLVTHDGLSSLADEISATYRLFPTSRVSHFAATGFDTSIVEMIAPALAAAALIVVPDDVFGGDELTRFWTRAGVTHALSTPSALATVNPADVPTIQFVVVGGEVCPPALADLWSRDHVLHNAYGPTETTCSVTMTGPLRPGGDVTIGSAMYDVTTLVLDRRLRPVTPGGSGELYISSPGVARGYVSAPGRTASRFLPNPYGKPGARMFRTGDRVRRTLSGELDFLGRSDHQVKVRGYRVEPAEIDAALLSSTAVAQSITVLETSSGDPALASYVVAAPGEELRVEDIERTIAHILPHYMMPSTITVIDAIPLTANRKVDPSKLPRPKRVPTRRTPPETALQQRVADAFVAVLGSDEFGDATPVDIHTSFFGLGGNSLSATRLVGALNSEFRTTALGVRTVVESPTVALLSEILAEVPQDDSPTLLVAGAADHLDTVPLSPSQAAFDRSAATYRDNLPFVVDIAGQLDIEVLRSCMTDLLTRHATLRTTYPDSPNGPRALVNPVPEATVSVEHPDDVDAAVDSVLRHSFDVRTEMPIVFAVVAAAPDEYMIACAVHHIAADGWSLGVLARDLAIAYASRAVGQAPAWDPLPVSYADYSCSRSQRSIDADVEYWRTVLMTSPSPQALPTDHPRPENWSHAGASKTVVLEADLVGGIDAVGRARGAGRYSVLRTALMLAVAQTWDRSDIVIGTPIAGRRNPRLDEVVGTFVNTVALRNDVTAWTSVGELISAAHATESDAFDHVELQFDELVDLLELPPAASSHPIFSVALSLDGFAPTSLPLDGLDITFTPKPLDVAKCDLHAHLVERPGADGKTAIDVRFVYAAGLFTSETIEGVMSRFCTNLATIVADPAASVSQLLQNR